MYVGCVCMWCTLSVCTYLLYLLIYVCTVGSCKPVKMKSASQMTSFTVGTFVCSIYYECMNVCVCKEQYNNRIVVNREA